MAKRHLHMTQDPTGKTANGFLEKSLPNIIVKEKKKVLLLSTVSYTKWRHSIEKNNFS